jgi:hypothetical protein
MMMSDDIDDDGVAKNGGEAVALQWAENWGHKCSVAD